MCKDLFSPISWLQHSWGHRCMANRSLLGDSLLFVLLSPSGPDHFAYEHPFERPYENQTFPKNCHLFDMMSFKQIHIVCSLWSLLSLCQGYSVVTKVLWVILWRLLNFSRVPVSRKPFANSSSADPCRCRSVRFTAAWRLRGQSRSCRSVTITTYLRFQRAKMLHRWVHRSFQFDFLMGFSKYFSCV